MKKIKIETTFDIYDSVEDLAIPVQLKRVKKPMHPTLNFW
jgi:hypothetical protein